LILSSQQMTMGYAAKFFDTDLELFCAVESVPAGLYLAGTTCTIHETKISFDALKRAVENYELHPIKVYTAGQLGLQGVTKKKGRPITKRISVDSIEQDNAGLGNEDLPLLTITVDRGSGEIAAGSSYQILIGDLYSI
jgi:hypothetical protein